MPIDREKVHGTAERMWAELMETFDGEEYAIDLVVTALWARKIQYHLSLSESAPETDHSEEQ
jgi:hypothetical protein